MPDSDFSPAKTSLLSRLLGRRDANARDALEEYVEHAEDGNTDSASVQERNLLSNILRLRDVKVVDVMVPRADIVAVEIDTPHDKILSLFIEKQYSRIPVYKDTLDQILGTLHVKDVLKALSDGGLGGDFPIETKELLRDIPFVSPGMDVFDLILDMRQKKRHMVMVIDEFGGVDGLVTLSDVIEEIVGDIHDEHDTDEEPQMTAQEDGSIIADARVDIEDFEERFGFVLSDEEREESDTLGGLVCDFAGRVPARGEVITHDTGMVFEVMDADPRRVSLLKIHNLPQ